MACGCCLYLITYSSSKCRTSVSEVMFELWTLKSRVTCWPIPSLPTMDLHYSFLPACKHPQRRFQWDLVSCQSQSPFSLRTVFCKSWSRHHVSHAAWNKVDAGVILHRSADLNLLVTIISRLFRGVVSQHSRSTWGLRQHPHCAPSRRPCRMGIVK